MKTFTFHLVHYCNSKSQYLNIELDYLILLLYSKKPITAKQKTMLISNGEYARKKEPVGNFAVVLSATSKPDSAVYAVKR